MKWLYLAIGVSVLIILYEKAPKIGGYLLVITVLGAWIAAQRKGFI
jgi:hypothetical protein